MKESMLVLVLAICMFGKEVNGCSCTSQTQEDHTGKELGRCLTKFGGKYWCYVSSTSSCPDKKLSSRNNRLYWSSKACEQNEGQENVGQDTVQPIKVVSGSGSEEHLPTCTTVDGVPCIIPFKHKEKGYRGCTLDEAQDKVAWCSTKVDQDGFHIQGNWGKCPVGCPVDPGYFIQSGDFGALGGSNSSSRGADGEALVDIFG